MPEITDITCGGSSRGSVICKISSALIVVGLAIFIACIADSYHKVNEGNVGIYYRHGALKDRVTDPGVHFLMPFFESFREIQIRPETVQVQNF